MGARGELLDEDCARWGLAGVRRERGAGTGFGRLSRRGQSLRTRSSAGGVSLARAGEEGGTHPDFWIALHDFLDPRERESLVFKVIIRLFGDVDRVLPEAVKD